jgi:hypothetical protein
MPVTRKYLCDCGYEWSAFHMSRDEPTPECPACTSTLAANIPAGFNITGTKAKAVDMAQQIMEQDYGLTDAHDNLREGDIVAKAPPPVQEAEAQMLTRAMKDMAPDLTDQQAEAVRSFWKTGSAGSTVQDMAQVAVPGAAAARSMGADPIELLHKGEAAVEKASGRRGMKLDIVGRAKITDTA